MAETTPKVFDRRAFVSMGVLVSGLGLPLTGLMNHLNQMEMLTVARHAWMAAHNSLGLLFCVFVIWHIVLNRKVLVKHLRGLLPARTVWRREAVYAVGLVTLVLAVFVGHAFHA